MPSAVCQCHGCHLHCMVITLITVISSGGPGEGQLARTVEDRREGDFTVLP